MKKKMTILIAFAALFISHVEALLPPLYEGIAEIRAILSDEKLSQSLTSGEMIQEIQKTENGYTILTQHHQLDVVIKPLPARGPGPARFDLEFKNPIPLK